MPHVVVVGGGIAGLSCALRLARGWRGRKEGSPGSGESLHVTVCDSASRFGGRIVSLKLPLANGDLFPIGCGAAYIHGLDPESNGTFLDLCLESGLSQSLISTETPKKWMFCFDDEFESWKIEAKCERIVDRMESRFWSEDLTLDCKQLPADSVTYDEYFSSVIGSAETSEAQLRAYLESKLCKEEGAGSGQLSVAQHYLCQAKWPFGDSLAFVNDGFNRVVAHLISELRRFSFVSLFSRSTVHSIASESGKVTVRVKVKEQMLNVTCDFAVVCVPLDRLQTAALRFEDSCALPPAVESAIASLKCGIGSKLAFELRIAAKQPLEDCFLLVCVGAFVSEIQFVKVQSVGGSESGGHFVAICYFVGCEHKALKHSRREFAVESEWKQHSATRVSALLNAHRSDGQSLRTELVSKPTDILFADWSHFTHVIPTSQSCELRQVIRGFNQAAAGRVLFAGEYLSHSFGALQCAMAVAQTAADAVSQKISKKKQTTE